MVHAVVGREPADLPHQLAAPTGGELGQVDVGVAALDGQPLGETEQLAADGVGLGQQATGEVVGVDLVAGEEQLLGPFGDLEAVGGDDVVEIGHGVGAAGIAAPARPLGENEVSERGGGRREAGQAVELVAEGEVTGSAAIDTVQARVGVGRVGGRRRFVA